MKVWQIIESFDRQLENDIPEEEKIKWLLQLDESFQKELIDTHEGATERNNDPSDGERELIIPSPYTDIYLYWLRCKTFLSRGEIELYNNYLSIFQSAKGDFEREYHRTHMPKGTSIKNFTGW